jgi:predicted dinucleotide-binding enzyme
MRIAVVGKGNVGGGLADLWEKAGQEVARIGRDGGDVSDADVVLFITSAGISTSATAFGVGAVFAIRLSAAPSAAHVAPLERGGGGLLWSVSL